MPGPLRAEGDVKLGSDMIALEQLSARLDRMNLSGRLVYSWGGEQRPARIEAALNAPELDLDRTQAMVRGMFGDTTFEWPREGALSINVGSASLAGVEAKRAEVKMQFDARGLDIERLAIADFGGAALAVSGRIDTRNKTPRGALTLSPRRPRRGRHRGARRQDLAAGRGGVAPRRPPLHAGAVARRAGGRARCRRQGCVRGGQFQDRWQRRHVPRQPAGRSRRRRRATARPRAAFRGWSRTSSM